jgi:hypothetical protein
VDPRAFLERWRPRSPLSPELDAALRDLARLAVDRPELASPARSLGELLRAAFHPAEPGTIDDSGLATMIEGHSKGLPAFQARAPRLDESSLVARSRRLSNALGRGHETAGAFLKAIDRRRFDLMACVAEVLSGRPEQVARRAEAVGLDPSSVSSILRLTLLPGLARFSSRLDRLRADGAWDRGDCPHCGSRPLLAESRGLEQRIFYRCGLCAADWPGERLRCPSCGENSPKSLHYSYVDGEQDRCRLAHCETCRYDWKVVSTLTALSPPAMIVADLATVHLDLLADDRRGGSTV